MFALDRWKRRHLFAAWGAYWAALAAVTLGPFARVAWRLTHLPEGHSSIGASFDNTLISLKAFEDGQLASSVTAHLGTIAMAIAIPPLVLWAAWLARRPRPDVVVTDDPRLAGERPVLGEGDAADADFGAAAARARETVRRSSD